VTTPVELCKAVARADSTRSQARLRRGPAQLAAVCCFAVTGNRPVPQQSQGQIMGITVCRLSRTQLIERLLSSEYHETLAHHLVQDRLWAVKSYDRNGVQWKYIALFLLIPYPPNEFGYKDMDETCHPFYYDCPLHMLEMVEAYEPFGSAAAWRKGVRQFHSGVSRQDIMNEVRARSMKELAHG
jgi:hypothetical protein